MILEVLKVSNDQQLLQTFKQGDFWVLDQKSKKLAKNKLLRDTFVTLSMLRNLSVESVGNKSIHVKIEFDDSKHVIFETSKKNLDKLNKLKLNLSKSLEFKLHDEPERAKIAVLIGLPTLFAIFLTLWSVKLSNDIVLTNQQVGSVCKVILSSLNSNSPDDYKVIYQNNNVFEFRSHSGYDYSCKIFGKEISIYTDAWSRRGPKKGTVVEDGTKEGRKCFAVTFIDDSPYGKTYKMRLCT